MDLTIGNLICVMLPWLAVVRAETIKQCLNNTSTPDVHIIELVEVDQIYHLYELNQGATWCQAYHFCLNRGRHLASVRDNNAQTRIQKALIDADIDTYVWIGGRTKDFGFDWTWVNNSLTGQSVGGSGYHMPQSGAVYGSAFFRQENGLTAQATNNYVANKCFCTAHGLTTEESDRRLGNTWFGAENFCHAKGGRLATLAEIMRSGWMKERTHGYWIGLYRNPWLWVQGDHIIGPVIFTSWSRLGGTGSCVVMDAKPDIQGVAGLWRPVQCDTKQNYVLCEGSSTVSSADYIAWPGFNPVSVAGHGYSTERYDFPETSHKSAYVIAVPVLLSLVVIAVISVLLILYGKKLMGRKSRGDEPIPAEITDILSTLEPVQTPPEGAPTSLPHSEPVPHPEHATAHPLYLTPTPYSRFVKPAMNTPAESSQSQPLSAEQAVCPHSTDMVYVHYDQIDEFLMETRGSIAPDQYTYIAPQGRNIEESCCTPPGGQTPDSYITAPGNTMSHYDDDVELTVYNQLQQSSRGRSRVAIEPRGSGPIRKGQYEQLKIPAQYSNAVIN